MSVPRSSRRRRAAIVLFAVAASAAPSLVGAQDQPASRAEPGRAEAADEVRATEIAFAQTMADRDLAAFLSHVSPEAVFFAGDRALEGRDAIEAAWAPYFEGPTPPFSWHPDQVVVLASGGLAFSSGPVHSPSGEVVGRFNSVWRLEPNGRWRIVFDKGS